MRNKIIITSIIFMFCSSISFAWWFLIPAAARSFLYVARFGVGVGTTAVSAVAANSNLLKVAEITIGTAAMLPIIDHFFFAEDPKVNANGKVNTQTIVLLKPTNQRQNPDPKKFNDPLPNEKDVKPKDFFEIDKESTNVAPTSYADIINQNGVGITGWYQNTSTGAGSNQDRRYSILLANNTTTNTNSCPSSSVSQLQLGSEFIYGWCGAVNGKNYIVGNQIKDRTCPTGYSKDNTTCKLIDSNLVMKPENKVPCEILKNVDGTFSADQKNPECLKNLKLKVTPNSVTLTHDPQTYDQLVSNPDGTLTIKTRSAENNGDLKIGKYDSKEEGFPTLSSINYGTTPPAETPGSESGNGSNVGQGCGQYASAPCAVSLDDSAFANKDIGGVASAALADSNSKYDELQTKLDDL